ncbi:MAG: hypothetical protein J7K29_03555 [Candidatus Cloacimonetes bacterium]|nr:hypothetical protein [Candidatus Cloacimonadota bacterium]
MQDAVDYNLVLRKAYQVSMHYVRENDMANDIAQATAIKYYLNKEKIEEKKSNSWIFTVSKNLSFNYLKKCKKEVNQSINYFEEKLQVENTNTKKSLNIDEIDVINAKEKELLKQYYNVSGNLSLLAKQTGTKKKILRQKIYRLEQEIKLFELIKNGVISTQSIPGTKLHSNIKNFLNKLKTCLNECDLLKMKHYFSECKINNEVSTIRITKIAQYDIDIIDHNKYLLNIGYYDNENNIKFFRIRFEISEGSTIKVIEFPIMPKKVIAFNAKEIPIEILRQLQPNEKGIIPLSQDEVEKILKSQKDKIKILVKKKNRLQT